MQVAGASPLTILEEFILLALDDVAGHFHGLSRSTFDCATAGAALMDMTLAGRIDNDLRDMFVVDATPLDDEILDPILRVMSASPVLTPEPIAHWLRFFADEGEALRNKALRRLEAHGIIRQQDKKILWVFETRRYPVIKDQEIREVRQRIMDAVLRDAIPSARDIMLTALAQVCGLFHYLLPPDQFERATPRIALICQMDLISQATAYAVTEIEAAIAMASGFH